MVEYLRLLNHVVNTGVPRESRAGPTRSLFGEIMRIPMYNSFPVVTTRTVDTRPIFGELAAFLTGSTQLQTFEDFGCHYWADNAEAWQPGQGVVGKIYGYQWRYWNGQHDQLAALLHGLREDPYGRRHLLTTWNPSDLPHMCLPPCHVMAQFHVDGAWLDCAVFMRSVDLCLGLPADIVLYATLLKLVAREVERQAGQLTFFFGDTHVYENHLEQARLQLTRMAFPTPKLVLQPGPIDAFRPQDAVLVDYAAHPAIKYKLNV